MLKIKIREQRTNHICMHILIGNCTIDGGDFGKGAPEAMMVFGKWGSGVHSTRGSKMLITGGGRG